MCQLQRSVWSLAALLFGLLWLDGVHSAPLQGSEWKPVRMGETAVPPASSAFVQFRAKGRLQGYGGCNRLFPEYEANEGCIFVGPVALTRMSCAEGVMALEAALAAALENARGYQRMRTRLVLFDKDGIPLVEMRQTDWD